MSVSPNVTPPDKNKLFIPEGYVLLSDAIVEVGRALFPKDWDGVEFQCSELPVEGDLICTPDQITRRAKVEHFLQDHAANKSLKIFYRDDVGSMHLTPSEWWNADNLTIRFTLCRIDPDNPFTGPYSPIMLGSQAKRQRFTLFVDRDALKIALATRGSAVSKATSSARAERDAVAKLIGYFRDGAHPQETWVKAGFWASYFQDHLSERAFNRAWNLATSDFPERRSQGRRSVRQSNMKTPH